MKKFGQFIMPFAIISLLSACEKKDALTPNPIQCEQGEQSYDFGESYETQIDDVCQSCVCGEDGIVECATIECSEPVSCQVGDETYEHDDTFQSPEGQECVCMDGEVTCDGDAQGCMSDSECTDNEFCDFAADSCGDSAIEGVCAPIPDECPDSEETHACGCDGNYVADACSAQQIGSDLNKFGGCEVPESDSFVCAGNLCDSEQACTIVMNDIAGEEPFNASCTEFACDEEDPCDCVETNVALTCEVRNGRPFIIHLGG